MSDRRRSLVIGLLAAASIASVIGSQALAQEDDEKFWQGASLSDPNDALIFPMSLRYLRDSKRWRICASGMCWYFDTHEHASDFLEYAFLRGANAMQSDKDKEGLLGFCSARLQNSGKCPD